MAEWFPGRRLSWVRLVILIVVLAALVAGAVFAWYAYSDRRAAEARAPWFAAYVDVTATPSVAFETPGDTGPKNVALAFIVAAADDACAPAWGGVYSLDEAESELDIDRRIARLRTLDGDVMVSFGGQANSDLAVGCSDPEQLAKGYSSVVERYDLTSIDMDIEGDLLADHSAIARQAQAIAEVQGAAGDDAELGVWLTLPVSTEGLTADGMSAVSSYLDAGVELAGVNAMTMDFNTGVGDHLEQAIEDSLQATHAQVIELYRDAGAAIGSATAWSRIGATPMIGQNDVSEEVFTLDDARSLAAFASERGMVRLSMWSLNRDQECDDNWPDPKQVSDSCSGVEQGAERFAEVLDSDRGGALSQGDSAASDAAAGEDSAGSNETSDGEGDGADSDADDPDSSPYPIWEEEAAYPVDTKIVWHRNVYEAKWWTEGQQPDEPAADGANPWRLLGPVLPGETPIERPELPDDAYPDWSDSTEYHRGDRVMFDGSGYEAKWWSRGDSPDASLVLPQDSPWRQLTDDEVSEFLDPDAQ